MDEYIDFQGKLNEYFANDRICYERGDNNDRTAQIFNIECKRITCQTDMF